MTRAHPPAERPPLLVLALGNILLADDGVGAEMLRRVEQLVGNDARVEFLDGGTQGLALLPNLEGRRKLLILDATALGAASGTVHVLVLGEGETVPGPTRRRTAHESNAAELLAALELVGERPESVAVVGIEPAELKTKVGLSERVDESLPAATARAMKVLEGMLVSLEQEVSCTS